MARTLRHFFDKADREMFVVVLLNAKHQPIGINTVSIGSLTASIVSPREAFKPAIVGNAAAVILAHNHPSGDPGPSASKTDVTMQATFTLCWCCGGTRRLTPMCSTHCCLYPRRAAV